MIRPSSTIRDLDTRFEEDVIRVSHVKVIHKDGEMFELRTSFDISFFNLSGTMSTILIPFSLNCDSDSLDAIKDYPSCWKELTPPIRNYSVWQL